MHDKDQTQQHKHNLDQRLRTNTRYNIQNPEETSKFYDTLSSIIEKTKNRESVIVGGDCNAKTKMANRDDNLLRIIGKHAKSEININGEQLINFCTLHDLRITNTFFKHRPIHTNTWQSPAPYNNRIDAKTNTPRKNPYRNQIDYVLIKNSKNVKILDSKAIITFSTKSDHKPVIAKVKMKWGYQRKTDTKKIQPNINVENFKNEHLRREYKIIINKKLEDKKIPQANQDIWDLTSIVLKETANNVIGRKKMRTKNR